MKVTIDGKDYEIIDKVEINNKNYLAYEDDNYIYINAYTLDNNKLNLLDITESEKEKVIKELSL